MAKVWTLVLKNVESAGWFVCPAVDDLLWGQKASHEEAQLVLDAVDRERLRKHKGIWDMTDNGLWGQGSPLRIEWIKAQIKREEGE
jgi:hypothetical protein